MKKITPNRNSEVNQSRNTSRTTHDQVRVDLGLKGWAPIEAAEEQPYDLIIDKGIDNDTRSFETIQVKSWSSLKTTSRRLGEKEPVSIGGKSRNNYNYYDKCIDWIATIDVRKGKEGIVRYWDRDTYHYKTPGELKKTDSLDFPINPNVYSYRKK